MQVSKSDDRIKQMSKDYTRIVPTTEIKEHYAEFYWGGNGLGDRFANKGYNYSVLYANKKQVSYSQNEDEIEAHLIDKFFDEEYKEGKGIVGIFIHSKRSNVESRPINKRILDVIKKQNCVVCGTSSDIVCDHKNDLYNDERVLTVKTQKVSDFQPLCNHCNLQKRQVCKKEKETRKLYSAKNITRYTVYPFDFPWEKKVFDENDVDCKKDTYWYDPVAFEEKICLFNVYYKVITEFKRTIKN